MSQRVAAVISWRSTFWARTSWWQRTPASSRSEFVMDPWGFAKLTSASWTARGKGSRQTMGGCVAVAGLGWVGGSQTPPMPGRAASQAPTCLGSVGTTSAMRVGRIPRLSVRDSKSASWSWTAGVSRTRLPSWRHSASWRCENMPAPPGMAKVMLRSSPRSWCHCLIATRLRPRKRSNSSLTRSNRCGGSSMVPRRVSMSHPKTVFKVDQQASPLSIFLTEAGSCRVVGSVESRGRNTSSSAERRMRRMRRRRAGVPCAHPMASSTKTSKYWREPRRPRREDGVWGRRLGAGGLQGRRLRGNDTALGGVAGSRRLGGNVIGLRLRRGVAAGGADRRRLGGRLQGTRLREAGKATLGGDVRGRRL